MRLDWVAIGLGFLVGNTVSVDNGLARTPQMGWNNWNSLGCDVSEDLLLKTSKILVASGLRDVGYHYVVLDDCWSNGRANDGNLKVDLVKFPSGMKHVADQIHSQGLLYGMYSSAGELTCAGYAGSLDHETQDARSFASWGVDYLKYDNCYHLGRWGTPQISFNRYKVMADAIRATGRNMLYGLCNWGEDYVHTWGISIANSWRISGDIYDSFSRPDDLCSCTEPANPLCVAPGTHCSVVNIINKVAPYVDRGKPGGWNDLDMLEVGNGGMTDEEYKAHFSFWAALKSPLLMGNDLRTLSASSYTILNNPAVIAISQDPSGHSVARVRRDYNITKDKYGVGETHVWSGKLYDGDQALLLLNAGGEDASITVTLAEIFLHSGPEGSAPEVKEKWDVFDLWADRMNGTIGQSILDASPEDAKELLLAADWYNSTEMSYEKGLRRGDPRLLGKKALSLPAGAESSMTVKVKMHSVAMYRLRRADKSGKEMFRIQKEL